MPARRQRSANLMEHQTRTMKVRQLPFVGPNAARSSSGIGALLMVPWASRTIQRFGTRKSTKNLRPATGLHDPRGDTLQTRLRTGLILRADRTFAMGTAGSNGADQFLAPPDR